MEAAVREDGTVRETVEGPDGERMRVFSFALSGPGGEVMVVQAAQSRGEVWESVRDLVLVLVPRAATSPRRTRRVPAGPSSASSCPRARRRSGRGFRPGSPADATLEKLG